jgi:hypothetical protein
LNSEGPDGALVSGKFVLAGDLERINECSCLENRGINFESVTGQFYGTLQVIRKGYLDARAGGRIRRLETVKIYADESNARKDG